MSPTFGLAFVGLVTLLCVLSTVNLSLRTRSIAAVVERFKWSDRIDELRWVINLRNELIMATASIRTVVSLVLVLMVVYECEQLGLEALGLYATTFAISFIAILLLGVAVPNAVAKYSAGMVVAGALPLLHVLHVFSFPLLKSLDAVDTIVRRLAGVPPRSAATDADDVEREILNAVSEGTLQGTFDEQEQEMIESVIQFGDIDAGNIMTPRTDIVAIGRNATLADAIDLINREGHSRIPVYDETIDNVLGVLYAKDLLRFLGKEEFDVTKVMRTVPFVPDDKPVDDLLQEFKDRKVHMAIVLDEYGGTSGLVTIEDILEELVGDIADEYEEIEAAMLKRLDDRAVEVDARMRIDDLNDELDIALPEHEDYETIGGFVFSTLGRIPRIGETCAYENVAISVIAAEPRRIHRLRLDISPPPMSDQNGSARDSQAGPGE